MVTTRQNKVSKLLQKEFSDILLHEGSHICKGKMVTITSVRISPDLAVARIYLSVFPSDKSDEIIKALTEEYRSLRLELGKRVKNQLRIVPNLSFFIDDSLDYLENINNLLKK